MPYLLFIFIALLYFGYEFYIQRKSRNKPGIASQKTGINALICHHFCIKNVNKDDIINCLPAVSIEDISFFDDFNWDFLLKSEDRERFIVFDKINGWAYLRWNVTKFEDNMNMAVHLSSCLATNVYYFFNDPWIATISSVFASDGSIKRAYYESHGTVLYEAGVWPEEQNIRNNLKGNSTSFEDVFWLLYEQTCPSIETINNQNNISATIGELKQFPVINNSKQQS